MSATGLITTGEIRDAVFGTNVTVHAQFRSHFGEELERAIAALTDGYREFQRLQSDVAVSEHAASVLASLHHLVSGYSIASGHMMRQFTESVAMALLCLDARTGVYAHYADHPDTYPVHRAPERLRRREVRRVLEERVEFLPDAWEVVLKMADLYDFFSHASVVALTFHTLRGPSGGAVLGAEFDAGKLELYRSDIVRRRSAAESLAQLAPVVMRALPRVAV